MTTTTDVDRLPMDSPSGGLLLVASSAGVVRLAFEDEDWDAPVTGVGPSTESRGTTGAKSTTGSPTSTKVDPMTHLEAAHEQLDEYFAGVRQHFDVPVDLSGVHGFRRRTLEFLQTTEYGSTTSYSQVAAALGSPRAARAVGSACSGNPVPILVPCHRVLTAAGRTGGYLGGRIRKDFLLRLEREGLGQ